MTKILKIRNESDFEKIRIAASVIKKGGLVAFPTETVYGLGANALDVNAVKRIFEVKKRPLDNPIIVHIANKMEIYQLSRDVPSYAKKLIKKFWPGPLTLVLKKAEIVPKITCANLDTIAIRMPDNKIALTLIKEAGVPIAAPSANLAGKPSPTSAQHVIQDLYGKIDIIIDGGPTRIGIESTVINLTASPPVLLRPGGITFEQLRKFLPKLGIHPSIKGEFLKEHAISPGMKYRHYAPSAEMVVIEGEHRNVRRKINELVQIYKKKKKRIGIITTSEFSYDADVIKFIGKTPASIAKNLFRTLREMDDEKVDLIIAEGVKEDGLGLAIMNRLRKASSFNVINV
ncbi:MAG: L-threonylcarbamoyladenylate synthase [Candidatus Parvarchaeota archaeon]|nr:L-threonylcarbamoyladenylate synthase [Candidatus Jingweiarchaeum tengchongense]MCW1298668.1 L-threonylcarbamoyladenylate synthase [Candidatus Jingweiarchaeum tengchongense]MCW1300510.1 L-threonylcarbamoyladenylate synthase [Candidatus Jingweiarchaeum tengchongense]MCW1304675.1 L-threonylcarbamoyladenylate synthase [Candidatus Jingweiarchaeum tengchongense]MCW1305864.1 L-threonylcarbamoyladenylate synthase [Candidatus Jingweiarchaeum tengchongense]